MKKYLIPSSGKFYKACLHTHSDVSDGVGSPEDLKKIYMDAGYSVVAFTDHEVIALHNDLSDENFLCITSFEKSINKPGAKDVSHRVAVHLNYFSTDKNNDFFSGMSINAVWGNALKYVNEKLKDAKYGVDFNSDGFNKVIKAGNDEGFLVALNHPVWSCINAEDYINFKGLWGIEVFNTNCDREGYTDTVQPFDDLLRKGERVFPLATDDAHIPADRFGGFVMIKADSLDYNAIIGAMKRGDFYASNGPEIQGIYLEDDILHIKCSPAAAVTVTTERRWAAKVIDDGKPLTEVEVDLKNYFTGSDLEDTPAPYFRITVRDKTGREAYSRAFFLDEIRD